MKKKTYKQLISFLVFLVFLVSIPGSSLASSLLSSNPLPHTELPNKPQVPAPSDITPQSDFNTANNEIETVEDISKICAFDYDSELSACGLYDPAKGYGQSIEITNCRYRVFAKWQACADARNKETVLEFKIPTAEEEALETPWIDPVDIVLVGGGLIRASFKAILKIASKVSSKIASKEILQKASQKMVDVYHYFPDPSGEVTNSILKQGVKASRGFKNTMGYDNRVFVSTISPARISKTNLFAYGKTNMTNFVKLKIPANELKIPAQNIYFGGKGARYISGKSTSYITDSTGQKLLSNQTITGFGTIESAGGNLNHLVNNLKDLPRTSTIYWLLGAPIASIYYKIINK